ncbi:hypothetical protein MBLNU230_g4097t1 [Neophaeotheca triangularis]
MESDQERSFGTNPNIISDSNNPMLAEEGRQVPTAQTPSGFGGYDTGRNSLSSQQTGTVPAPRPFGESDSAMQPDPYQTNASSTIKDRLGPSKQSYQGTSSASSFGVAPDRESTTTLASDRYQTAAPSATNNGRSSLNQSTSTTQPNVYPTDGSSSTTDDGLMSGNASTTTLQSDRYPMSPPSVSNDRLSRPSYTQQTPSSTAPIPVEDDTSIGGLSAARPQNNTVPSLSSDNLPDVVSPPSIPSSRARSFSRAGDSNASPMINEAPPAGPVGNGVIGKTTEELTADAERAGFIGNTAFTSGNSDLDGPPAELSRAPETDPSASVLAENKVPDAFATDEALKSSEPVDGQDAETFAAHVGSASTEPQPAPSEVPRKLPMPGSFDTPQQSFSGDMPTVSSFSNKSAVAAEGPAPPTADPTTFPTTQAPGLVDATPNHASTEAATEPTPSNFNTSAQLGSNATSVVPVPEEVDPTTETAPSNFNNTSAQYGSNTTSVVPVAEENDPDVRPVPTSRPTVEALTSFTREMDTAFKAPADDNYINTKPLPTLPDNSNSNNDYDNNPTTPTTGGNINNPHPTQPIPEPSKQEASSTPTPAQEPPQEPSSSENSRFTEMTSDQTGPTNAAATTGDVKDIESEMHGAPANSSDIRNEQRSEGQGANFATSAAETNAAQGGGNFGTVATEESASGETKVEVRDYAGAGAGADAVGEGQGEEGQGSKKHGLGAKVKHMLHMD